MIYDCFNFFNELDLLEIRFYTLYEVVDKFVIVESNKTHSGIPKDFNFENNKDRFKRFLDKVEYIKLTDVPDDFSNLQYTDNKEYNKIVDFVNTTIAFDKNKQPHYGRDFYQKEAIRFGLTECNDNDIIISSDCDEIINPDSIARFEDFDFENRNYSADQDFYMYYFNVKNLNESPWYGSRVGMYRNLKNASFNELRASSLSPISNGGWHFSYMGGANKIKEKIQAYSAQEFNNTSVLEQIDNNVNNNTDVLFRGHKLKLVQLDNTYPDYVVNNKDKFANYIK
tara:strand:- start:1272 stop:2120 length:849 start_codon:yes stop_codon:yes gene_type:complete